MARLDDGRGQGNRWRPLVWGMAACLLLLPAVAMRFPGSGVDWTGSDFVAMAVMLAIACGIYELGAWLSGNIAYRAGFGVAALAMFLTIWVNGAVGMLGSEGNRINLMFAGVLLVGAIGACIARFRAGGMARAMFATAAAQLLVVAIALPMGFEALELTLTACFALPWIASGLLFRAASGAGAVAR